MRPRYKDYLLAVYCTFFDGITGAQVLYRADKRGPGVWLGEQLQMLWYRAHNNRFYEWLDREEA